MDSPEIQPQQQMEANQMSQAEIAAKYGLAKWIFRRGQDFVKGKVLEIGEGEGHVAKYCRREGFEVDVLPVNLQDESFNTTYSFLLERFDLLYVLPDGNKLVNSRLVVANSASLLKEDGYLIALVPCSTALYEGLGQGLADWTSYNRKYIRAKLGMHYDMVKARFFEVTNNPIPIVSTKYESDEQVRIFERMNMTDFAPANLSILIVMKKK